jgi:D-alanyl-D-alanine carboxypeptidase
VPRPARSSRPAGRRLVAGAVVGIAALGAGAGSAWAFGVDLFPSRTPVAASSSTGPATTAPATADPTPVAAVEPVTPAPSPSAPAPTATGFDLARYSTADPTSLWVVVNKLHPLDPIRYEPADLVWIAGGQVRSVVVPDLQAMIAAAKADGVRLSARTAYRSYNFQVSVHADLVRRQGAAYADKYSARPGYSEHQTGLALDLHSASQPACDLKPCFGQTAEARWVAEHGWEYGFVVRYTPDNTAATGYSPEAWHLGYVGRDLAGWMHATGVTSLEQAFGVTGGPSYPD